MSSKKLYFPLAFIERIDYNVINLNQKGDVNNEKRL